MANLFYQRPPKKTAADIINDLQNTARLPNPFKGKILCTSCESGLSQPQLLRPLADGKNTASFAQHLSCELKNAGYDAIEVWGLKGVSVTFSTSAKQRPDLFQHFKTHAKTAGLNYQDYNDWRWWVVLNDSNGNTNGFMPIVLGKFDPAVWTIFVDGNRRN